MSDQDQADFGNLLKTAERMQQQLSRVQEQLAKQVVEGSAGGGMVKAVANKANELNAPAATNGGSDDWVDESPETITWRDIYDEQIQSQYLRSIDRF